MLNYTWISRYINPLIQINILYSMQKFDAIFKRMLKCSAAYN